MTRPQPELPFEPEALADVVTPALVIVPSRLRGNVAAVVERLGGPDRWRPHIKTVKMRLAVDALRRQGVRSFKCATPAELSLLCECGVEDALLAHFEFGANARLVRATAEEFETTSVSTLVDDDAHLRELYGAAVGAFIDIDVGMHRTGLPMAGLEPIRRLASAVVGRGVALRGLHAYDGHLGSVGNDERPARVRAICARLVEIAEALLAEGIPIPEIVTSGSPTFAPPIDFGPLAAGPWTHRVSPGTVVLADGRSLARTAGDVSLQPAAFVLSRVVSVPTAEIVTCDAGHKALAVDVGLPHCRAIGHPELEPLPPSEEHLSFRVVRGRAPRPGTVLALLPEHICPTVNLFDHAVIVDRGVVTGTAAIAARGHPR